MPRRPDPPDPQVIDVPVPLGGLDVSVPYSRQSRRTALGELQTADAALMNTTPAAANVRGFDAQTGRRRLSRRMGLTKYVGSQPSGFRAVQELAALSATQFITGSGYVLPGSAAAHYPGTALVGLAGNANYSAQVWVGNGAVANLGGGTAAGEVFLSAAADSAAFYAVTTTQAGATRNVNLYKIDVSGKLLWSRPAFTTTNASADARYTSKPPFFNQGTPGTGVGTPAVDVAGTPAPGKAATVYLVVAGRGLFRFSAATGADVAGGNPWVTDASLTALMGTTLTGVAGKWYATGGLAFGDSGGSPRLALGVNFLGTAAASQSGWGVLQLNPATGAVAGAAPVALGYTASPPAGVAQPTAFPYVTTDGANFWGLGYGYAATGTPTPITSACVAQVANSGAAQAGYNVGDARALGYYVLPAGTYYFGTLAGPAPAFYVSGPTANLTVPYTQLAGLGTALTGFGPLGGQLEYAQSPTGFSYFSAGTGLYSGAVATTGLMAGVPQGASAGGGQVADGGTSRNRTNYNRAVALLAVAGGTVAVAYGGAWSVPQGGAAALNAGVPVVRSAVSNQRVYFADGFTWAYYDLLKNAVVAWTASQGTLPTDSGGFLPRLVANWRGRVVLAGLPLDPFNVFFSAVGDGTNFAYNPSPSVETQAVAANLHPMGLCPDLVTALVPYSDDVLVLGCDSHIYQVTGDPMAGGRIDLVSDTTGMAWGNPWCKSPEGVLYFLGSRGQVYEMAPGAVPLRVSQPVDNLLAATNMRSVVARMAYHERFDGFHLFLTPLAGGAAAHYYFDVRTRAWWQDSFANPQHNPFAALAFDGDAPGDRVIALGGQDGYVRVYATAAPDDDGSPIASSVLCGPVQQGAGAVLRLDELWGVLAGAEGSVGWGLQTGDYAEQAATAAARQSGTFAPGRSLAQPVRAAGVAHYVALARNVSEPAWSLEALRCYLTPLSQTRQRQFG